ncbi:MAG: DUF2764 family protein [Oscillospiraceae bacterium]|nr:DUF2764 family protein [Oscillospiraceae bacterium]
MAEYYLISQLPSLDGLTEVSPLPITTERFTELCHSFLGKKPRAVLDSLTIAPAKEPEDPASGLVAKWNEGERSLRLALAKLRADKLGKQFDAETRTFSPELLQAVRTAVEIDNPMDAEKFLNKYRLDFLETLRPLDAFSEEFLFYYGLKLKLVERMRKFNLESGEAAYRNIYGTIINTDRSEALK